MDKEYFVSLFMTDDLYQAVSEDQFDTELPLTFGEDNIEV